RAVLGPPARGRVHHPVHPLPPRPCMAWDHGLSDPRLQRHPVDGGMAPRRRGGRGAFGGRLYTRRGPDDPRPRLSHAIRADGASPLGRGLRGPEPLTPQISAATSFARRRYSCSFIAAGFAEIRRYESFRTIFSLTFWRNRMIEGKPFCEIMYSRPSRRTAALPPSDAKSEIAEAMSTRAHGSATAMSFAGPPADFESQMNPAPSIGYRDRKSSGWMRVMQSPRVVREPISRHAALSPSS